MNNCYVCDSTLTVVTEDRDMTIRDQQVRVQHELLKCESCGEEFLTPAQLELVQKKASDVLREKEGLLTAAEIRTIRSKLGLSQVGFEKLLGVGPKTCARWERGTVFQNGATDSLMRVVREFPNAAAFLAKQHGVTLPADSCEGFNFDIPLAKRGGRLVYVMAFKEGTVYRSAAVASLSTCKSVGSSDAFVIRSHPSLRDTSQGATDPHTVPIGTVNRLRKTIGI